MRNNWAIVDLPRASWLRAVDPRFKLAILLWVSTLSVLLDAIGSLAGLCLVGLLLASGLRLSRRGGWWLVMLVLVVAWGTLLSQAIFYAGMPRTRWFSLIPAVEIGGWRLPGLHFYREGAAHGLAQSLRAIAVMLTGLSVCLSTSPERLLAALARLRAPASIGFMLLSALRFLPVMLDEFGTVRQARRLRSRGRPRERWHFQPLRTLQAEAALLYPVMAAALRRSSALATSVVARGFNPQTRRSYFPPLRFAWWEKLGLVVLLASWLAPCIAKGLYWLYLAEIYYHPALRPVYDFARQWL